MKNTLYTTNRDRAINIAKDTMALTVHNDRDNYCICDRCMDLVNSIECDRQEEPDLTDEEMAADPTTYYQPMPSSETGKNLYMQRILDRALTLIQDGYTVVADPAVSGRYTVTSPKARNTYTVNIESADLMCTCPCAKFVHICKHSLGVALWKLDLNRSRLLAMFRN